MRPLQVLAIVLAVVISQPASAACDQNGIGHALPNTHKAWLNTMKNRRIEPMVLRSVTVSEMLSYPDHDDANLEASDGVVLRGQLLQAVHEGAESPNCGIEYDYHIFIGAADPTHPNGAHLTKAQVRSHKRHSIVVELTPNIQDMHPDWADKLQQLTGQNVCVTGWVLYDYEHHPQIGRTRGTLWEIHPITGIALLRPSGLCVPWQP